MIHEEVQHGNGCYRAVREASQKQQKAHDTTLRGGNKSKQRQQEQKLLKLLPKIEGRYGKKDVRSPCGADSARDAGTRQGAVRAVGLSELVSEYPKV